MLHIFYQVGFIKFNSTWTNKKFSYREFWVISRGKVAVLKLLNMFANISVI